MQVDLNAMDNGRRRGPAIRRFEFHAIPAVGIVAGGDHDGTGRLPRHHGITHRGRRCGGVRQPNLYPRRGKNFCGSSGRIGRKETRVVADDQAACGFTFFANVLSDGRGHATHVGKSEVISDHSTPAIRTECDLIHVGGSLLGTVQRL
jgi:hypothetical protein